MYKSAILLIRLIFVVYLLECLKLMFACEVPKKNVSSTAKKRSCDLWNWMSDPMQYACIFYKHHFHIFLLFPYLMRDYKINKKWIAVPLLIIFFCLIFHKINLQNHTDHWLGSSSSGLRPATSLSVMLKSTLLVLMRCVAALHLNADQNNNW